MTTNALNDLIAELRQLDRDAPILDELLNVMLAILEINKTKPKVIASKCAICDRAKVDDCVSGWMPRAYTVNSEGSDYHYARRCANFTTASKSWLPYDPELSKPKNKKGKNNA